MKNVLLAFALATQVSANTITLTDPIPMAGKGHWEGDQFEMGYSFWAYGSIGGHTILLSADSPRLPLPPPGEMPMMTGVSTIYRGGANIDDIGSRYFEYLVNNSGVGYLKIFDNSGSGTLLASCLLQSWITQTSYNRDPGPYHYTTGTFTITPVPETGTFTLLLAGLALRFWLWLTHSKPLLPNSRSHALKELLKK